MVVEFAVVEGLSPKVVLGWFVGVVVADWPVVESPTFTETADNPAASAAPVTVVLIESALAVDDEGTVTVRSIVAEAARLLLEEQPS